MQWPEKMRANIGKFEENGTHPAANHNAIAKALTFHEGIRAERKAVPLRYQRDHWMKRLWGRPGVILRTSPDPAQSCAVANGAIEGLDAKRVAAHLWDAERMLLVAINHEEVAGLRVTPHVYTTREEIDRFAEAMELVIEKSLPA